MSAAVDELPIWCKPPFHNGVTIAYLCLNACSSFLSIMGSTAIIYLICRGQQKAISHVQNRLLLCISVIDIMNSTALGLSFIPAPNVQCSLGIGNQSTCAAQGFFVQLGLAAPGYTMVLSIYSFISIAYNETIARRYEPFMHATAVFPMLAVAIYGVANEVYFSARGACWIDLAFQECSSMKRGGRYKNVGCGIVGASFIWGSFTSLVIAVCLFKIYRTIRKRAARMKRFVFKPTQQLNQDMRHIPPTKRSILDIAAKESAMQAVFYVAGYAITYFWTVAHLFFPSVRFSAVFYILNAIFLPLHGFWNFLTFIRPRYLSARRKYKDWSLLLILKFIFSDAQKQQAQNRIRAKRGRRSSFPLASVEGLFPDSIHMSIKESITGEETESISSKDLDLVVKTAALIEKQSKSRIKSNSV
mmetsp:Transcript_61467/g.71822  ORF Transcript_61467/g.71822 Transcript_61467/m.71822 type:complete len:416 (+) Transcript_61467:65-1312(+)